MKKILCYAFLWIVVLFGAKACPAAAAPAQPTDIAVVFLGSFEFQQQEYYTLATDSLAHRFPSGPYNLIVGDFPQRVFDRYSDKSGLIPGIVPSDKAMIDFAWTHSFDRVLFLIFTPPVVKADDIALKWEAAEASIQTRAVMIEGRRKKKLTDLTTVQSATSPSRTEAKRDAFQKCLEELRGRL